MVSNCLCWFKVSICRLYAAYGEYLWIFLMFLVLLSIVIGHNFFMRSTLFFFFFFPSAYSDVKCRTETKIQLVGAEAISKKTLSNLMTFKSIKALKCAYLKDLSSYNGDRDFCTHLKLCMGLNTFLKHSSCLVVPGKVMFSRRRMTLGVCPFWWKPGMHSQLAI